MIGKLFLSLHCYFRLYAKELIYVESFAYLIEKQSIYIRNRYTKKIPKKALICVPLLYLWLLVCVNNKCC